jgi:hypothetical protein
MPSRAPLCLWFGLEPGCDPHATVNDVGRLRSRASRLVRRAVLFHLSLTAPGLVACSASGLADTSRAPDGGAEGGTSASCSVDTTFPPQVGYGTCDTISYHFNGSPQMCGGDDAGAISLARCQTLCPVSDAGPNFTAAAVSDCSVGECYLCGVGPSSYEQLMCTYGCASQGRRPAGLRSNRSRAPTPVAGFLSRAAYLEAASVPAFERLATELATHGAPRRLVSAAKRAARDEVRHARVMSQLAVRDGGRVRTPRVPRAAVRPLVDVAMENAVEGCVNETFGAAVALVQSRVAARSDVRNALRRIAVDEMRHADLAWRVASWLETRLDSRERARVARAQRRAVLKLVREAANRVHPAIVRTLGVPDGPVARSLAVDLARSLWV